MKDKYAVLQVCHQVPATLSPPWLMTSPDRQTDREWLAKQLKASKKQNRLLKSEIDRNGNQPETVYGRSGPKASQREGGDAKKRTAGGSMHRSQSAGLVGNAKTRCPACARGWLGSFVKA